MKFIDIVEIFIKSGDGGPGHVSFRHEKGVPKGGPDGGNGGKGGDVVFVTDPHLNTLLDFKYKRHFTANNGAHGGKYRKTGPSAKNLVIKVPCGTLLKSVETDKVIADLTEPYREYVIAPGGMGGLGNSEFATPTNQTPRYAQPGIPGVEMQLTLELKLIADIGIVGLPNVGKSTLISVISAAKPKIADYHFTTLIPNLGIVSVGDYKNYTVADIPGLIEGAADGKGLGIQFLRHVERSKALLFMLDATSENPKQDYKILRAELKKYNPKMDKKRRIICFSKCDALDEEQTKALKKIKFAEKNTKLLYISAVTGLNIDKIKILMWELLSEQEENT
jgi:GTP-binding protein